MLSNRAFGQRGQGVFVARADGTVTALEFNAFLKRIAVQQVAPEDVVVSGVLTDGWRRRAGDLRLFALVRSGAVPTEDLPLHTPDGILAEGEPARAMLARIEQKPPPPSDAQTLLRAVLAPLTTLFARELLRSSQAVPPADSSDALLRPPASPPDAP
jgi:hypothetical protein